MAFDIALTVGIDSTGAKTGADTAVKSLNNVKAAASGLDETARVASRSAAISAGAFEQVGQSAFGNYSQVSQVGTAAWDAVASAAETAAQRQISAANQAAGAVNSIGQSASETSSSVLGLLGFTPAGDIATAESNIRFLQRLLQGGVSSSSDFIRAQNLGVASEFGLADARVRQALEFQNEALRILLRRRELEGRAIGGPVTAGRPFVVGENGPEVFVPNNSGQIIPRGTGMSSQINITVNGAGDPQAVAQSVIALINREAALGRPSFTTSVQRSRSRRGG